MDNLASSSHKQILKSTGIIGGEQVINILAGVARSKAVAILLGPVGMGIAGLYQSALDLIKNGTGLGLGFSAVKDVAEAAGTGDHKKISLTIAILRRWVWATGILGMVVALLFCKELSILAFGDNRHAWPFALLSVTLLFSALSSGQLATLQGLRRIADMAKANVIGVLLGLAVSIPLYWFFKYEGIVFSILVSSMAALLFSWVFARKIKLEPVRVSVSETVSGGAGMARIGFFMVLTTLMSTGSLYVVRVIIARKMSLDAVGQFQAAWTVSSIYLATVLNSMTADYFPRLSAERADVGRINTLVNEQTEVAILIAGPLIVGMISFMGVLVYGLYSAKFHQSVGILQWQILGTFFKVVTWPMGFVLLTKGRPTLFVMIELLWNLIYISIIWLGWRFTGIEITGISYLAGYLVISILCYALVRNLTGFAWSSKNKVLIITYGGLTLLAFFAHSYLSGLVQYGVAAAICALAAGISYHHLRQVVSIRSLMQKFLRR